MYVGRIENWARTMRLAGGAMLLFAAFVHPVRAQDQTQQKPPAKTPVVTKVDGAGMWAAIKPDGRPVLVNFWATWCDPCREEFPDLVRIAETFKGRVDVVTVSLDDPMEVDTAVPQFLSSMGAWMPAYLLSTPDEDTVITSVSKEWGGALPFTVIFDSNGKMTYQKLGKFRPEVLTAAINRTLGGRR